MIQLREALATPDYSAGSRPGRRGSVLVPGQLKRGKVDYSKLLSTQITSALHKGRGSGSVADNSASHVCQRIHANDSSLFYAHLGGQVIGLARYVADAVQHNMHLTALNLSNNRVTWLDVSKLASALWSSPKLGDNLKMLNLSCNDIDSEGGKFIGEILKKSGSLTDLNVAKNRLCDDGVLQIASAFLPPDLLHGDNESSAVEKFSDTLKSDEGASQSCIVDRTSSTKQLSFPVSAAANSPGRGKDSEPEDASRLEFSESNNTDCSTEVPLKILNLSGNMIGGNGECEGVGRLLQGLQTNMSLTELDLSNNYLTGRRVAVDVAQLLTMNRHVRHINLYGNGLLDRSELIVKGLMNNDTVQTLNIIANGIGYPAENQIGKLAVSAQRFKAEAYSYLAQAAKKGRRKRRKRKNRTISSRPGSGFTSSRPGTSYAHDSGGGLTRPSTGYSVASVGSDISVFSNSNPRPASRSRRRGVFVGSGSAIDFSSGL
jgi:Ran GTPase-activating protein (RanGAP) involved in mRNA processing and transport